MPPFVVRALRPEDREWVAALAAERWGGAVMVARGRIHTVPDLPGFCAEIAGARAGLVTYAVDDDGLCEIVSLDSLREGLGIGTALIEAVRVEAEAHGCRALVLVTTNDNTRAPSPRRARSSRRFP